MKRFLPLIIILTVIVFTLGGCAKSGGAAEKDKINVVCTMFPQYDWLREIVGDREEMFNMRFLTDTGADMHSYQPSVSDIASILSSDILICNGGESEKWVEDMIEKNQLENTAVINVMNSLEVNKKLAEHAHEHENENHHDEYDEHVWLSLENASYVCETIKDELKMLDPDGADVYEKNCKDYVNRIFALKGKYKEAAENSSKKGIVVADRFAFKYLADEFDITYWAAFPGCSAETEASFETVISLADKIKENNISVVLTMENSDKKLAKTVIDNSGADNCEILALNSMQSVTKKDVSDGMTYLKICEGNLEVLKKALGE